MNISTASLRSLQNDDSVSIRVAGPVGGEALPQLDRQIRSLLEGRCTKISLDLTTAEYLDSDGTRWLQSIQSELQSRGGVLGLTVRTGSRVDRTVTLLRLDAAFEICRESEAAEQEAAFAS